MITALLHVLPVLFTHDYLEPRDGLGNCRVVFERGGPARVAFLGGSITHNPGWRDAVARDLATRFPEAEFDFVNAGIPSMGSTPGAFRLQRDVLARGRIDLLFVEAAVNDSTNGRSDAEQVRGMEGIVRHVRRAQPEADVVMLHFVDPAKMADYRAGRVPAVVANHERVAARYGVPSLHLAREVTERIDAGEFTWEDDFRDLHPSPFGQRLYADSIARALDELWSVPLAADARVAPRTLPEPLDAGSYANGVLLPVSNALPGDGFELVERWRPTDGKGTRAGFVDVPMLVATEAGAKLELAFEGRAVGVFVAAGPDAGVLEYRVDGGEWRRVDLFTRWSGGLHLPWAHVLAAELEPGAHRLELRVADEKHARSLGHAVRIAHFLVDHG